MTQAAFVARPQPGFLAKPLYGADFVALADAAQLASWREWALAGPIELPLTLEVTWPAAAVVRFSNRPSPLSRLLDSLERVGPHLGVDHMI